MLRQLLTAVLLIGSSLALADTVTLDTPQGALIGTTTGPSDSVKVFKGIPFAAAPVGNRRWQAPVAAPNWSGEFLADSIGPNCMQESYGVGTFFYRPARITSEDCLYLNVWTTAEPGEKLPVMVWIHGGALTWGSGARSAYDGTNLAQKGVVLLTVNYRLGVFGYFAHPELIAESDQNSAGNYSILDQIQALKWVQQNIAAFGGDPDNVTIFGESAGAWSVNFLTASPLAEGLFHKAIGESGARLDPRRTLTQAAAAGTALADSVNAGSLAELRAIPAPDLLSAVTAARFVTDGVVDGWAIPEQPFALFSSGRQNKVPVLIGFNAEEGTTLGALQRIPDNDDVYISRTRSRYGELANEFLSVYPADDLRKSSLDSFRDATFGWNMLTWARLTANVDEDAYLYFFSHRPPGPLKDELGAFHAAEIVYAFNNPQELRNTATSSDRQMAETMSNYWVNFARTGSSNGNNQPVWDKYSSAEPNYVELDGSARPASNLLPANWDLFDKVMAARRQ